MGLLNRHQAGRLKDEWTQSMVTLSTGKVFTRIGGLPSAKTVVVVHGFVLASDYMMPVATALSPYSRTFALDLPGYGLSEKPSRPLSLPALADSLAEWMRALDLRRAHFIGNSFGCQILIDFAARYTGLVERLVLQGPTVDIGARTLTKQIVRLVKNSRIESPGLGRLMMRDYWRAGWRGVTATASMALADRPETKLPRVSAPTLIVRGSRDVLSSQDWTEHMLHLLPRGRLLVMPGLAHTINYTAPDLFVETIRPFLRL